MVNKYYYLVTSLPYLKFEDASPITKEKFFSECRKWLSPSDLETLSRVDINSIAARPDDPAVIKKWKSFDYDLRAGLAEIRKARKASMHERIPDFYKDILDESTPLLMEKRLQRKRWDFIEEESFGYHFDMNVLILYLLKLQVLERLAVFEKEKGKSVFEDLCRVSYEHA